jgi:hypothetical protein
MLRALFERLAATRPYWGRLCGSGSAVAAVYRSERERDDATMVWGEKQQRLSRTTTRAVAVEGLVAVHERPQEAWLRPRIIGSVATRG